MASWGFLEWKVIKTNVGGNVLPLTRYVNYLLLLETVRHNLHDIWIASLTPDYGTPIIEAQGS